MQILSLFLAGMKKKVYLRTLKAMKIQTEIGQISRNEWNTLLAMSSVASWFQSAEAYSFFASLPHIMRPFVVAVERDKYGLKGVVVGYIPCERNTFRQYFMRRAIIIGGPLLADDIQDDELRTLLLELQKLLAERAIYIETRNFNDYSRWKKVFAECGFAYQPHYDIHINCTDKETMWQRIHESKKRAIRKYEKEGWTAVEATSAEDVKAFYKQLSQLYRKKIRRPLFDEEFFLQGWQRKVAKLLIIRDKEGCLQGGIFCPIGCDTLYEWYIVGSIMPTFAALQYATKEHIACFDLMGAGEPNKPYGVRDFKLQFGGELKEYGRFVHITNPCLYSLGKTVITLLTQ